MKHKSKKKKTLRDIRENRGAQPVREGAQPFKREGKRVKMRKRAGHHPATTVVQDAFDFIFGHIIDGHRRGRWFQWRSICYLGGVLVLSEEGDVKDRVYVQSSWEVEFVCNCGHLVDNWEGT